MIRIAPLALLLLSGLAAAQEPRPTEPEKTAFFGVRVAPLDAQTRTAFEIPADVAGGVVIASILDDSPAERAGLRAGDVITSFGGTDVRDAQALVEAVRSRAAGEMVSYVVRRGTGTIAGTLRLGEWTPEAAAPVPPPPPQEGVEVEDVGRRTEELDERIAKLRERVEVLRERAAAGSPAGWEEWLEREERALVGARASGDHAAVMVSQVRLELLRELKRAGMQAPPAAPAERLHRLERKLDRVLELLERQGAGARRR